MNLPLPHTTDEFERQAARFPPGTGASLAVYSGPDLVVDRWGGERAPGTPWERDTLTVTFSATKGVTAAVLLLLAEDGRLDTSRRMSHYWPSFATNAKEGVSVAEFLSHQSGLPYWDDYGTVVTAESPPERWLPADEIASSIAGSRQVPGTYRRFAYHAITFGWLAHGLTRALTGAALPDLFADYLAQPYGLDYHIGLPPSESARVATLVLDEDPAAVTADPDPELTAKSLLRSPNGVDYLHNLPLLNSPGFHAVPQGACNGIGTAVGLAGAYAALLEGGRARGDVIERFTRPVSVIPGPGPRRYQGLGFQVRMPTPWNAADTAFGHTGAGGGAAFLDPRRRLAVGFTTNRLVMGADDRLDRLRAAMAADLISQ